MKTLTLITALVAATPAVADKVTANVTDRFKTVYEDVPYTKNECVLVDKPIYGTTMKEGDAAGGALLGMILGGLVGKGVSGDDGGAAAGAVIGGLIGADKGSKPQHNRRIVGYETKQQCTDVTYYRSVERTVYDYSVMEFEYKGEDITLTFRK